MRLPWRMWRRPSRWGALLLGVWLIAWGALQLVPRLQFPYAETALAVLAVAAGVVLLLER